MGATFQHRGINPSLVVISLIEIVPRMNLERLTSHSSRPLWTCESEGSTTTLPPPNKAPTPHQYPMPDIKRVGAYWGGSCKLPGLRDDTPCVQWSKKKTRIKDPESTVGQSSCKIQEVLFKRGGNSGGHAGVPKRWKMTNIHKNAQKGTKVTPLTLKRVAAH